MYWFMSAVRSNLKLKYPISLKRIPEMASCDPAPMRMKYELLNIYKQHLRYDRHVFCE